MRLVIVGLVDDGRSRVKEIRPIWPETTRPDNAGPNNAGPHNAGPDNDTTEIVQLWKTNEFPFELPQPLPADQRQPRAIDQATDTTTAWIFVRFPPNRLGPFHRTETIDYDVVVTGSTALLLENGEIELGAGDAVMLPGLVHRWRTGPEGCVLAVTALAIGSSV